MTKTNDQEYKNATMFPLFFNEVCLFESKKHNDVASSVENVNLRNDMWREVRSPISNLCFSLIQDTIYSVEEDIRTLD